MSTSTVKISGKAITKAKANPVIPVVGQEDVIVQKTYRMAETLKKYPLPRE